MLTSFVREIRAESNEDSLTVVIEDEYLYNGIITERIIVNINNDIFYSITYDGVTYIYDSDDVLLATARVIKTDIDKIYPINNVNESRGQNDIVDTCDVWRSWSNVYTYQVSPAVAVDTVEALNNILSVLFSPHQSEILNFLSVIRSFCSITINLVQNTAGFYVSAQFSYNQYCDILRKERFAMGTTYGSPQIHWLDTPWIYNVVPEACRILTNRYPY